MKFRIHNYFRTLHKIIDSIETTDKYGNEIELDEAINWIINTSQTVSKTNNKLMFIGNGGSAGIASHLAIDFSKNGNIPAMAFNDGAALTCLGNDLGYENVFAKQIELHAHAGDILIAISSSGSSANILNAVSEAENRHCRVVTLSGFAGANPLRQMGDVNLYVPSGEYGFVEITHLILGHLTLDIAMGWGSFIETKPVSVAVNNY